MSDRRDGKPADWEALREALKASSRSLQEVVAWLDADTTSSAPDASA